MASNSMDAPSPVRDTISHSKDAVSEAGSSTSSMTGASLMDATLREVQKLGAASVAAVSEVAHSFGLPSFSSTADKSLNPGGAGNAIDSSGYRNNDGHRETNGNEGPPPPERGGKPPETATGAGRAADAPVPKPQAGGHQDAPAGKAPLPVPPDGPGDFSPPQASGEHPNTASPVPDGNGLSGADKPSNQVHLPPYRDRGPAEMPVAAHADTPANVPPPSHSPLGNPGVSSQPSSSVPKK